MADQHQTTIHGHEPDSVSMKFVLNTGLGLALLIVISMLLAAGLLVTLTRQRSPAQVSASIVGKSIPQKESGLDPDKRLKLHEQQAAEEHVLESYEWIDAKAGIARIPIRRAIQILTKEGLPKPTKENNE